MDRSLGPTDEKIPWRCHFTQNALIQMSPAEAAAGRARMEKQVPKRSITLELQQWARPV